MSLCRSGKGVEFLGHLFELSLLTVCHFVFRGVFFLLVGKTEIPLGQNKDDVGPCIRLTTQSIIQAHNGRYLTCPEVTTDPLDTRQHSSPMFDTVDPILDGGSNGREWAEQTHSVTLGTCFARVFFGLFLLDVGPRIRIGFWQQNAGSPPRNQPGQPAGKQQQQQTQYTGTIQRQQPMLCSACKVGVSAVLPAKSENPGTGQTSVSH